VTHARAISLTERIPARTAWSAVAGIIVVAAAVYAEAHKGNLLVIVALAALAVVLAAVRSPALATGLLVVVVFTRVFAYAGSDRLAPGALALLLGLSALATQRIRSRPDALVPFLGVAALYAALGAMSMLWATAPSLVLDASRVLVFQILVAVGVICCIGSLRELRWATWALIAAGTVVGALAIWQYASGRYTTDIFGLSRASIEQIVGKQSAPRAGGPVGDANFFGQMMVVVVVLAMSRARAESRLVMRLIAAAAVVISAFTVVITYSRGGVIAMAIGVVLAIAQSRHKMQAILVVGAAAIIAVAALPSNYTQRLSELTTVASAGASAYTTDPAIKGRTSSWIVATHMIEHSPVVGVGFGNFSDRYLSYSRDVGLDTRGEQRNAHSFPLQVLAEQGFVGAASLLAVIVGAFACVAAARRRLRASDASYEEITVVSGIRDALIVYLVASIFLHNAYPQLFWLLLGLAWATHQCVPMAARREAIEV